MSTEVEGAKFDARCTLFRQNTQGLNTNKLMSFNQINLKEMSSKCFKKGSLILNQYTLYVLSPVEV